MNPLLVSFLYERNQNYNILHFKKKYMFKQKSAVCYCKLIEILLLFILHMYTYT